MGESRDANGTPVSMVTVGPTSTRIGGASKLEVGMDASLFRGNTTSRVVNEHGIEEIEPIVI